MATSVAADSAADTAPKAAPRFQRPCRPCDTHGAAANPVTMTYVPAFSRSPRSLFDHSAQPTTNGTKAVSTPATSGPAPLGGGGGAAGSGSTSKTVGGATT